MSMSASADARVADRVSVPAELLEQGRVDAAVHEGGHRAALEAVAAERTRIETGGGTGP